MDSLGGVEPKKLPPYMLMYLSELFSIKRTAKMEKCLPCLARTFIGLSTVKQVSCNRLFCSQYKTEKSYSFRKNTVFQILGIKKVSFLGSLGPCFASFFILVKTYYPFCPRSKTPLCQWFSTCGPWPSA